VAEFRSWLLTPFGLQQRTKGVMVDCVGVAIETGNKLGLTDIRIASYAPDDDEMRRELEAHYDYVPLNAGVGYPGKMLPGDLLWIRPRHLACVTQINPVMIVHASNRKGVDCVVETSADSFRRAGLINACFRYRGIQP